MTTWVLFWGNYQEEKGCESLGSGGEGVKGAGGSTGAGASILSHWGHAQPYRTKPSSIGPSPTP